MWLRSLTVVQRVPSWAQKFTRYDLCSYYIGLGNSIVSLWNTAKTSNVSNYKMSSWNTVNKAVHSVTCRTCDLLRCSIVRTVKSLITGLAHVASIRCIIPFQTFHRWCSTSTWIPSGTCNTRIWSLVAMVTWVTWYLCRPIAVEAYRAFLARCGLCRVCVPSTLTRKGLAHSIIWTEHAFWTLLTWTTSISSVKSL